jgi:bacillithiol system protein YtxJ
MGLFKKTTHLSSIIEASEAKTVTIFKYSDDCGTSSRLADKIEKEVMDKKLEPTIYMVTVQTEPVLSRKIEEWFDIKHESPQIITILKGKVIGGMISLVVREIGMKGLSIVGQLFLVRLLTPEIFGIYAVLTFIVTTLDFLLDLGLTQGVIQNREKISQEQFSTIFFLKFFSAFILFVLFILLAPLLKAIYPQLTNDHILMMRVLSLIFLFRPIQSTITSILDRNLEYKLIARIDIVGISTYYLIAIFLSVIHFQVWALVLAIVGKETAGPTVAGGRVLRTGGLNKIVEVDKGNMTLTVEAGADINDVRARLESECLFLHVAGTGTMGGLLSRDAGGPELGRDLLGLKAVSGKGELMSFGAKVMKNVAGYDVVRLFKGAWGRLGVVVEMTLRIHARKMDPPLATSTRTGPPALTELHDQIRAVFDPCGIFNYGNDSGPHPLLRSNFPQEGKENIDFPSPLGRG